MKRKNNNKKGFTIVELVIVIAVIAILAAVLIPTFSNIIRKAHISSDTQLIRNLNTALVTDKVSNGDHNTMFDALEATKASGYDVGKINASATDNEILWDSKNDVFCYFNNDKSEIEYIPETTRTIANPKDEDYWVISKTINGKYSTYLYETALTSINNLTTGLDVGNETTITSISYVNETQPGKSVVIRTNSFETSLTINAPLDTVKHYGEAQVITLTAVGTSSYYEHGSVNLVDIKKGRLVITNDAEAEVGTIYLSATSDAYDGIILATQSGSELPDLVAREAVNNPTTGEKLVVTIQTNVDANGENPTKTEEIYLYPESDVKEATNGYNVSDLGLLVVEAISSEAQAQAAEQITDEEVLASVKETKTADLEEVTEAATMFAGGKGTKNDPYLIANGNQWYNLLTKYQGDYMGSSSDGLYVVLKGDIDITGFDITSYNSYPRNFHLDGNGFTMKNFETSIWGEDGTLYLANTFTNFKLENCHSSDNSLFGGTQNSDTASVTFNNVDLNNCSAVGGAYQYYDGSATAKFIDCDATNTNVLGGYMASGGFIGNISTGVIVIDHCSFGGSVVSTQSACGGFVGQSANYDPNKITIKDSTIIAGTVIRNVAGESVAAFNAHTGTQDYAQFNNSFYGTLETTGTKYKQGTDAATKTYEPICTAADFRLNSDEGTLTYSGSAGLGKIAVQVYVIDDYIYNGKYYSGYNWYVCDPIKANNVVNGTTISGIPVITDFYNVVSSTDTPVGLQTTDTTYVDEIHNGIFYFNAQTYSWGHYMLGGTYKDGAAIEPTSLKVYIKVTVYDNSGSLMGVVSGATLNYSVDLSNHGN